MRKRGREGRKGGEQKARKKETEAIQAINSTRKRKGLADCA